MECGHKQLCEVTRKLDQPMQLSYNRIQTILSIQCTPARNKKRNKRNYKTWSKLRLWNSFKICHNNCLSQIRTVLTYDCEGTLLKLICPPYIHMNGAMAKQVQESKHLGISLQNIEQIWHHLFSFFVVYSKAKTAHYWPLIVVSYYVQTLA